MQFTVLCRWAPKGSSKLRVENVRSSSGLVLQPCGQRLSMAAGCCTENWLENCTGCHTAELMFPCATEMLFLLVAKCFDDGASGFSDAMPMELPLTARQWNRGSLVNIHICRTLDVDGRNTDQWRFDCLLIWVQWQVHYGLCNHILFANLFSKCRMSTTITPPLIVNRLVFPITFLNPQWATLRHQFNLIAFTSELWTVLPFEMPYVKDTLGMAFKYHREQCVEKLPKWST